MVRRTRREFLEESMLAAAAAMAVGADVPELGAEEKESDNPSERIRIAVLGVHGRGNDHLNGFQRPGCEIAVVCDPDEEVGQLKAEATAKRTKRPVQYVKDLRRVMDDPSIDVVSIATPNHWHALAAIWAIQAGKDVYVEKPVSHNVSEGRRIVEAARKHGRICQTGTQIRSSRGVRDAMAFIHAGKLGDVKVARGLCYKGRGSIGKVAGPQEVPAHIDYNLWSGPAQLNPLNRERLHYDWHWIWDYGNGDLGNQGIHQMDLARWALGVSQLADEVIAFGGRFGYTDDGQTPNTEVVCMKFGLQELIFEVRGLPTDKYKGAGVGDVIHCADGYLVIPSYSSATAFDPAGKPIQSFNGGGDHYANFLGAVRSRKAEVLNADILEGHLSSALCHLGNISYRLGQPIPFADGQRAVAASESAAETLDRTKSHLATAGVNPDSVALRVGPKLTVDPKAETFIDSSDADAFLTRDYRSPFVVPDAGKV